MLSILVEHIEGSGWPAVKDALNALNEAKGRIVITGMGKSGHIGRKIAATMSSLGAPTFFVHPAEASHGDLGMITERDAVIALSNSGNTAEIRDIILYSKSIDIPVIAITMGKEVILGKECNSSNFYTKSTRRLQPRFGTNNIHNRPIGDWGCSFSWIKCYARFHQRRLQ